MQCVIYEMRFANGDNYVGASTSLRARRSNHRRDMRKGRHPNRSVQEAFDAAGPPEFRVVASGFQRETLHLLEAEVIGSLAPTLNRASPLPIPGASKGSVRSWGPYANLREAAAGEGMSYTQIKRESRVPYEKYREGLLFKAARAQIDALVREDEKRDQKRDRAAHAAKVAEAQKVLVDGVLDFPANHRARIGMTHTHYRRLRSRGLDPFAPENRTPGMPSPPRLVTAHGRTQSVTEWALETGLSKQTITQRMDRLGWPPERAVSAIPYEPGHFMKQAAAQLAEQRAAEGLEPTV